MSYLPASITTQTAIKADVFRQDDINTGGVYMDYLAPATQYTNVTLSSGYNFNLPQGANYYITVGVGGRSVNLNGDATWQIYDITNSNFIGFSQFIGLNGSQGAAARQGRIQSSILINASSIPSGGLNIGVRLISNTGGSWEYFVDGQGLASFNTCGFPTLRILELAA